MRGNSFKKNEGWKIYLLCTPLIPTLPHCRRMKESGQQTWKEMTLSAAVKDEFLKTWQERDVVSSKCFILLSM